MVNQHSSAAVAARVGVKAIGVSALLLTTSIPALAQIETVVVTAQKRSEDVQTVPIAVTAYSSADLKAHQIQEFKDLVFSTPNVTYTKTNFTGADFQIRGIGIAAIAGDAEAGVAVHQDDVFLANPPLAEANFYDLERIEVLRGPQSTLFGRGATGGTVNIITAKPDLEQFMGNGEFTYGNFNQIELKGMLNVPLIEDKLAVRVAGDWQKHDGFVRNIATNDQINSENTYSFRGSIRFQPWTHTTIDLIGSYSHEADSKMRAVKQLCTRDPSAVLGCLPESAGTEALNVNAQFTNTVASQQGFGALFGPALAPIFSQLGLFDLTAPANTAAGNVNPSNLREVNTDFDPIYHAKETFVALNVKQQVVPWLDATLVAGYEDHSTFSQESYNNIGSVPLDAARLGVYDASLYNPASFSNAALPTLAYILSGGFPFLGPNFNPAYAALYAPFFSVPGQLPASHITPTGIGLTSGDILRYTPNQFVYDQSDGYDKQYSIELRFNSNFQGPLNFLVGGYYLSTSGYGDYYVPGNVLDYPGILLGALLGGLTAPSLCAATGCIQGPSYYHNFGRDLRLESKAMFGEVYYDVVPDLLKITLGARFTDDHKSENDRIAFLSGLVPIGSPNEDDALAALVAAGLHDFDCSNGSQPGAGCPAGTKLGPNDVFETVGKSFDKWTGRVVVDYTPKLDFTDSTLIYASYSRGYKSGGFNPGVQSDIAAGIATAFKPEGIDAFELGTKNTLLDGTLQANMALWYYNYQDFQVSSIIANTSVNSNIGARLWGIEGEFLYAPDDNWQFNLSFGHTHSAVGDFTLVNPRNPSNGRADVVLIKDATATGGAGQNCVLYRLPGATALTPADAGVPGYFQPSGGQAQLAAHGVPLVNFGMCVPTLTEAEMEAFGFSYGDPLLGPIGSRNDSGGVGVNLHGNELQNTPPWTVSFGIQYHADLAGGYSLVPRIDVYWQDKMWGRIFTDGADRIDSWSQVNLQLTLNAPDDRWYVQAFVKNLTESDGITGEYLTSSTSALYTNAFLVDPRTYGARIGARF